MIRKTIFIAAIITLVTSVALGKPPHPAETGFSAKTGDPAGPPVQNLPCGGRGDIKITRIHFTPPDNLGVTWVVERVPCHYDINRERPLNIRRPECLARSVPAQP